MYVLCVVRPAALDGEKLVIRYACANKRLAMKQLVNHGDCLAWRLHDGYGWCDGTENAWKWITNVEGPGEIVLYG